MRNIIRHQRAAIVRDKCIRKRDKKATREGHRHKKCSHGSLGVPVSLRPTPTSPRPDRNHTETNPLIKKKPRRKGKSVRVTALRRRIFFFDVRPVADECASRQQAFSLPYRRFDRVVCNFHISVSLPHTHSILHRRYFISLPPILSAVPHGIGQRV